MCESIDISEATATGEIYHERQSRMMCALHVINNMLQCKDAITKDQLDNICKELSPDSWLNPHKNPLGLGNYDVNVLITAFQRNNLQVIWFDKRKDINRICWSEIVGVVLNVPSTNGFLAAIPLLNSRQHWLAIRRISADGPYYNLDSKLSKPDVIGDETRLKAFLVEKLADDRTEALLVVSVETEQSGQWERKDL